MVSTKTYSKLCVYNFSTTNAPYTPTVYKTVCRQHRGSGDSSELAEKEAQLWMSSLMLSVSEASTLRICKRPFFSSTVDLKVRWPGRKSSACT